MTAVTNDLGNFTNMVWQNSHHHVVIFTQRQTSRFDPTCNTPVHRGLHVLCEFSTHIGATAWRVHTRESVRTEYRQIPVEVQLDSFEECALGGST